ncbi:hypothetical protein [Pedobacter steynii]|uniref:Uncharacterized protein n=1 Tax=Pedobacter steynii TaxID=430522 RepID=A0A1D7QLV3_9SPHI|nr:hypothetical protein [Pedobacter steynii]AOM79652.1 hypothetical protein BFS30_22335 [Pedobacter steynii]
MDPFNIILSGNGEKIDLNIHPQEAGNYKIFYHGALVGEVFMGSDGENWEAITAEQLQPEGFPIDEYGETSAYRDILLDNLIVQQIGRHISK